jgi:hypothetical protein
MSWSISGYGPTLKEAIAQIKGVVSEFSSLEKIIIYEQIEALEELAEKINVSDIVPDYMKPPNVDAEKKVVIGANIIGNLLDNKLDVYRIDVQRLYVNADSALLLKE